MLNLKVFATFLSSLFPISALNNEPEYTEENPDLVLINQLENASGIPASLFSIFRVLGEPNGNADEPANDRYFNDPAESELLCKVIDYATNNTFTVISDPALFWNMVNAAFQFSLYGCELRTFLDNLVRYGLLENKHSSEIFAHYTRNAGAYDCFAALIELMILQLLASSGVPHAVSNGKLLVNQGEGQALANESPEMFYNFGEVANYKNVQKTLFRKIEMYACPFNSNAAEATKKSTLFSLMGILPDCKIYIPASAENYTENNFNDILLLANRRRGVKGITSLTPSTTFLYNNEIKQILARNEIEFISIAFDDVNRLGNSAFEGCRSPEFVQMSKYGRMQAAGIIDKGIIDSQRDFEKTLLSFVKDLNPQFVSIRININRPGMFTAILEAFQQYAIRDLIFDGVFDCPFDATEWEKLANFSIERMAVSYRKSEGAIMLIDGILPAVKSLKSLRIVKCNDSSRIALKVRKLRIETLIVDAYPSLIAIRDKKQSFFTTLFECQTLRTLVVDVHYHGRLLNHMVKKYAKRFRRMLKTMDRKTKLEKIVLCANGKLDRILQYSHETKILTELNSIQ